MRGRVVDAERVGGYELVRVVGLDDAGAPGQFHMLRALGAEAFLGRPLSAMRAVGGLVEYLCDVRGPGLGAICRRGAEVDVQGPFGRGFDLDAAGPRPLLCAGGVGIAVMPWLAEALPGASLLAGFRDSELAQSAALVPCAQTVVVDPTLVTEPLADAIDRASAVLACGPTPMLEAVAALCVETGTPCQTALEAPMACGFGACYGCVVRLDGRLVRLCVEGPVVDGRRLLAPAAVPA